LLQGESINQAEEILQRVNKVTRNIQTANRFVSKVS